jgi:hypothetical protein
LNLQNEKRGTLKKKTPKIVSGIFFKVFIAMYKVKKYPIKDRTPIFKSAVKSILYIPEYRTNGNRIMEDKVKR